MGAELQYVVPVVKADDETYTKIVMRVQGLRCLTDEHGNLKHCMFGTIDDRVVGNFIVFYASDREVAQAVHDELKEVRPKLMVLPVREFLYKPEEWSRN